MKFEVGKHIEEGVTKYLEGIRFDINDMGGSVFIKLSNLSTFEINSIKNGKAKFGYYEYKNVIFLLLKFENMNWMDCPYTIYLSKNLTKLPEFNVGQGLALKIYLINADTGILEALRLIGLSNKFSELIKIGLEKQLLSDFNIYEYDENLCEAYKKYTTREMVSYSKHIFNL